MTSYERAFQAFSEGAVDTAREILDASIQGSHASRQLDNILSLCCFRSTLAAMEGSDNITELLEPVSCTSTEMFHLLTSYLNGIAAMANGDFEVARLKFEAMKKEYSTRRVIDNVAASPGEDNQILDASNELVGAHLAYLGLGAVYFHGKEYKNSFTAYRKVLETLGSASTPKIVRVGMGLSAFGLHHPDLARKILEREVALHPDNDLALLALLIVYVHLRQLVSVAETIAKLIERLPENVMILLRVADLLYFRAIEEKSILRSSRAIFKLIYQIRLAGTSEEKALADYHEGRILIVLGKLAEARTFLEAAILALPSLLPARIHYAHLLLLSRREAEGMRELLKLNSEHANQREVLQLLAFHLSRRGRHEPALQFCRRLMDSVAPGDVRSLALATWCSRLDKNQCLEHHRHLIKILKEVSVSSRTPENKDSPISSLSLTTPPVELLANCAVLSKDVGALQTLVDETLGASFLPRVLNTEPDGSSTSAPISTFDFSLHHIPLLYNLALLKEGNDRQMAYHLYVLLVKKYCTFYDPYFRLFHMCIEDGHYHQGVQWLTLLIWIIQHVEEEAMMKARCTCDDNISSGSQISRSSSDRSHGNDNLCSITINLARSFLGIAFFEHRKHKTSIELFRSGAYSERRKRQRRSSSSKTETSEICSSSSSHTISVLFLGVYYLLCAQRKTKDNYRFLTEAKKRFEYVLKVDPVNLLAAHGLSCCLGLLDENYHCQSLLSQVCETKPNCAYVLQGNRIHLANLKARLENYVQAIDYIEKTESRSTALDVSLAFCYAKVFQFEKAQRVLVSATEKKERDGEKDEIKEQDAMLLYNASLIHFTAFLHGVKQAGATTLSTGRQLRDILEKAVVAAARFFSLPALSEEMTQGSGYLKQIGQYCVNVFNQKLQPLILIGIENERQEDADAARWEEVMSDYRRVLQENEERMRRTEETKRAEKVQASTALRDSFLRSGFALTPGVLDRELQECISRDDPQLYMQNNQTFLGNDEDLVDNDSKGD